MNDDAADSASDADTAFDHLLEGVGPRLRALRQQQGATLAQVSAATGVSVSTLSRLEAGQRRPTLELLLPLAHMYQVALDDLVDARPTAVSVVTDTRCHLHWHTPQGT